MDLRDEFAMAALSGLMANVRVNIRLKKEPNQTAVAGRALRPAYMAEAMMEERRKRTDRSTPSV